MFITYTGITAAILIGLTSVARLLYLSIVNKRRYPNDLFKGKYLVFFILTVAFAISGMAVSLLTLNNIENLGLFIVWASLCGVSALIELSIWVIFWSHGYEIRYQFEKIVAACPFVILEFIVLMTTALCSVNIPLIIIALGYGTFSLIWHLKGWSLTRPDEKVYREGENND